MVVAIAVGGWLIAIRKSVSWWFALAMIVALVLPAAFVSILLLGCVYGSGCL